MSKASFRAWLRQLPEPYAFLLDGGEKVLLGKGARRFSTVEEAIRQHDPDKLSAVDKEGAVLRAYTFRHVDDDEKEDEPEASTPDQKTLGHFATLLSNAYKQGAADHADAYKETFSQVVSLANSALARVQGLEKLLNQMLKDIREDALAAREELEAAREEHREAAGSTGGGVGVKDLVSEIVKRKVAQGVSESQPAGGSK